MRQRGVRCVVFRSWSYGRIVAFGLFLTAALTLLCSGVSILALRAVVADNERVIAVNANRRLAVEGLRIARERRARFFLRYILSRDDESLQQMRAYQREMVAGVAAFRALG